MPDSIFTIGGATQDDRDDFCNDGILTGRDPDTLRLAEMRRSSGCVPGHGFGAVYERINGVWVKTFPRED